MELTTNIPNIFMLSSLKGVPLPKIFLTSKYYVDIHNIYLYVFCCFFFLIHVEFSVPLYIHLIYLHTYTAFIVQDMIHFIIENRYIYILYLNKQDTHLLRRRRWEAKKATTTRTAKI